MRPIDQAQVSILVALMAVGCGSSQDPQAQRDSGAAAQAAAQIKSVAIHIVGFKRSKSGAIWMAWPNAVKQALDESDAVVAIEMRLEQDRFVVAYDASKATAESLVAIIDKTGFTAALVTGGATVSTKKTSARIDDPIFTAALAQAKRENRPIVLAFEASWCVPCQRMARETFPAPTVSRLLDRCIFLKIDTDQHPDLAKGFGVAGLPDLRFLAPDGSERKRLLDFQDATTFARVLKKFLEEVSTERDGLNTKEASVRTKRSALIDLAHDGREFKQAFNAQQGRVRVVLIVSPGWPMCQNGAREVQQKTLETIESDNLNVFVVWTPRYKGDSRAKAVTATKIITDKRAQQFWDAGGYIGTRYARTLKLPRNARFAWDVYFVFDSQAEWKGKPPLPNKWMHQLSRSQEWKESRLDGDTFRKYVADLLEDE